MRCFSAVSNVFAAFNCWLEHHKVSASQLQQGACRHELFMLLQGAASLSGTAVVLLCLMQIDPQSWCSWHHQFDIVMWKSCFCDVAGPFQPDHAQKGSMRQPAFVQSLV